MDGLLHLIDSGLFLLKWTAVLAVLLGGLLGIATLLQRRGGNRETPQ